MHFSCILDSAANLIVCHMVFIGNIQKFPIVSHLKGVPLTLGLGLAKSICLCFIIVIILILCRRCGV